MSEEILSVTKDLEAELKNNTYKIECVEDELQAIKEITIKTNRLTAGQLEMLNELSKNVTKIAYLLRIMHEGGEDK